VSVPTKEEAEAVLTPYHGTILRIVREAWNEWREVNAFRVSAGYPPMLYHRSISNYVFDAIARRAIPAFAAEPRVNVEIEAQTFKLYLKGVIARFKKGGEDQLGCSIRTQRAMSFMDADGIFPGYPPETGKVEIIWIPNELWTQVERVLVVARDDDTLLWSYEIRNAGETAQVIPFPQQPPDGPDGGDGGDLVKPKNGRTKKKDSGE